MGYRISIRYNHIEVNMICTWIGDHLGTLVIYRLLKQLHLPNYGIVKPKIAMMQKSFKKK